MTQTWTQTEYVELHTPDGTVMELRSCRMPGGGLVTLVTDVSARRGIEQQLQQAQKLEVLGQLTGGVAHDFNNYLGTILGNLALLESSVPEDGPARVQWQRVRRAAASAAGLTRRLLAYDVAEGWKPLCGFLGVPIPSQFLQMVPYIITIVVLAGVIGKASPPKADGIPFEKE